MADVYKFKVKLEGFEDIIWRDIEITSVSNIAKLGYAVLAAFEAQGSHLFNIKFKKKRYEILFQEPEFSNEVIVDPIKAKLSSLKLLPGDVLDMEYDYGAGWTFSLELLSVTEMKRGSGNHYPYITDGRGKGIIEDISPYELAEIIYKTDKAEEYPRVDDIFLDGEKVWDYTDFNLKYANAFFKEEVLEIQHAYESYE